MIEFKGEKGNIEKLKINGKISEVLTEFGMLLQGIKNEQPEEAELFFLVLKTKEDENYDNPRIN